MLLLSFYSSDRDPEPGLGLDLFTTDIKSYRSDPDPEPGLGPDIFTTGIESYRTDPDSQHCPPLGLTHQWQGTNNDII